MKLFGTHIREAIDILTAPAINLDHHIKLLENDHSWYVQLEVAIPKVLSVNVTQERLSKLADAFTQALQT